MSTPQPLTYTVEAALAVSGLGRTTLYKMIGDGRLSVRKVGRRTLIPADELRRVIGLEEAAA